MKIAMDYIVLDRFKRILLSLPDVADDEEEALNEILKSGPQFCLLPSNLDDIERPVAETYLRKCSRKDLDIQQLDTRKNELHDQFEDLEEECQLLAEAEQLGVDVILTTNGNFIHNLGSKARNVKIVKPTQYIEEIMYK